jgi:beta-glucosidase
MADRDTLDLPGDQLALLSAVINASKGPVIVVLVNGRPATFGPGNALLEGVDALVCAWRPGMMGGKAIWNVLSGRTLPTGRLAQNWPRNVGQIGGSSNPWYKHVVGKWAEWHPKGNCQGPTCFFSYVGSPATPLFPFGFGLGYGGAKFVVESLQCSTVSPGGGAWRTAADPSTPLVACAATVKNVGSGAGSTLIQLYVQDPVVLGLTRYWLRLVGWARVSLAAGASAPTPLSVDWDALSFPSAEDMSVLSVPPGDYDFYAGESYMAAKSVSSVVAL